jgi:hypothetical protein
MFWSHKRNESKFQTYTKDITPKQQIAITQFKLKYYFKAY